MLPVLAELITMKNLRLINWEIVGNHGKVVSPTRYRNFRWKNIENTLSDLETISKSKQMETRSFNILLRIIKKRYKFRSQKAWRRSQDKKTFGIKISKSRAQKNWQKRQQMLNSDFALAKKLLTGPAVSIDKHCKYAAPLSPHPQSHHTFELSTFSISTYEDKRNIFKTQYLT